MGGRDGREAVGFGRGFKRLPGAEEARSNGAELAGGGGFFFFFFLVGCALEEKKMFGFGLGLARWGGGVSRADLASCSAGGVGGRQLPPRRSPGNRRAGPVSVRRHVGP